MWKKIVCSVGATTGVLWALTYTKLIENVVIRAFKRKI